MGVNYVKTAPVIDGPSQYGSVETRSETVSPGLGIGKHAVNNGSPVDGKRTFSTLSIGDDRYIVPGPVLGQNQRQKATRMPANDCSPPKIRELGNDVQDSHVEYLSITLAPPG
jgi:hypothetical protein